MKLKSRSKPFNYNSKRFKRMMKRVKKNVARIKEYKKIDGDKLNIRFD